MKKTMYRADAYYHNMGDLLGFAETLEEAESLLDDLGFKKRITDRRKPLPNEHGQITRFEYDQEYREFLSFDDDEFQEMAMMLWQDPKTTITTDIYYQ